MSIPTVQVPVVIEGARSGRDASPSGVVPLASIAPSVGEGEVLWMSRGRDYRIQLKGTPKRVVGDQVLPEQPRFAQFEAHAFRSSDPETNRQLEAAKERGFDFWKMSDIQERTKAAKEADLVRAAEALVATADSETMEKLSVILGAKGFKLPKRDKGEGK